MTNLRGADLLYQGFWNALDWFYPPSCAGCGLPGYRLCDNCLGQIHFYGTRACSRCGEICRNYLCASCRRDPPPFDDLFSLAHYEGVLRECVHALKYDNNQGLAALFTSLICTKLRSLAWDIDLVIPVPLSPERLKTRGYNQSALLARPVALRLGWTYSPFGLMRIRNTKSQVELSAEERLENVAGAFNAERRIVSGNKILLMDDVTTTGATLRECAKALKSAGASAVYCFTLASPLHQG